MTNFTLNFIKDIFIICVFFLFLEDLEEFRFWIIYILFFFCFILSYAVLLLIFGCFNKFYDFIGKFWE